uniref:Uncharacterized protein n=1 Tax=Rousettus aegyptiacus TaxID=9407 RepID=A0A7J8IKY9_ROUAE|nr:hypothetical protein HJG63_010516 [Rousettus aegyptiacus]
MNHLVVPLTRRFPPASSLPLCGPGLSPARLASPLTRGGCARPPRSPPCVSLRSCFLISPIDCRTRGPGHRGPGPSSLVTPARPLAREAPLRGGRTPAPPHPPQVGVARALHQCVGGIAAGHLYGSPSAVLAPDHPLPPPTDLPRDPSSCRLPQDTRAPAKGAAAGGFQTSHSWRQQHGQRALH